MVELKYVSKSKNEFDERENELEAKQDQLQKEKDQLQKEIQRMSEMNRIHATRIKLDIGGHWTRLLHVDHDPRQRLTV